MPNFQNNFATNLTSNTSSGVTTTPINSIPTVDAPYYIALDATNLNSHYEVVYVTSDTATNINHAATTYDHTTAEEVRMIVPAVHLNTWQNIPEGGTINIKFVPSVASNNLTVALKGLDGNDHSVTNPGYVMIGGTLRTITSALSITVNAGSNWLNMGSAELATKELDLFMYLNWSGSAVRPAFSRIPFANLASDFTGTSTGEKDVIIDGAIGTGVCVNIGRFAATLSAGAGYTWSVPTFTASNLIQRPIYETRWLDYQPVYGAGGSMTYGTVSTARAKYKLGNEINKIFVSFNGTTGGSANPYISFTVPFSMAFASGEVPGCYATLYDAGVLSGYITNSSTTVLYVAKYNSANWAIAADKRVYSTFFYQI